MSIEASAMRSLWRYRYRLLYLVVASVVVLPPLAWGISTVAPAGGGRAILALGVAPSEIAAISMTTRARGEPALAAALVTASSLTSVFFAGPLLALCSASAHLDPWALSLQLSLVVALPLALGAAVAALAHHRAATMNVGSLVSTLSLAALVWEVASEVDPSAAYLASLGLSLGFSLLAGGVGLVLTLGMPMRERTSLGLPFGIKDFAVAAGVAQSAFGPSSTAVLGAYGLAAIVLGTTLAARVGRTGRP